MVNTRNSQPSSQAASNSESSRSITSLMDSQLPPQRLDRTSGQDNPPMEDLTSDDLIASGPSGTTTVVNTSLPPRAPKRKSSEDLESETVQKAKKSPWWNHFTRPGLADGKTIDMFHAICNYCNKEVASSSLMGTASMKSHAIRCVLNVECCKPTDSTQTTLKRDNVTGATQYHQFDQARCDKLCLIMIIRDELPFRFVEHKGYKDYIYELQPRYKQPDRKKIAAGVLRMHQDMRVELMSQFIAGKTRVSITTDTWTSIQNINYMVLTAHFLDNDWILHKRILNFCVITSHKGEDIGMLLDKCLRSWGITKVFTITVDNATANKVAIEYMKKRFKSMHTLQIEGKVLHLRCACHVINLIVQDGIKELQPSIEAIWNSVKYIRSSPARLTRFREVAVMEGHSDQANLPLDVVTRWNSTYKMLVAALKYSTVINRMYEEDEAFHRYFQAPDTPDGPGKVGPPDDDAWDNARSLVVFLKVFYDATIKLSAWKTVTAHLLFAELIDLQVEINENVVSTNKLMADVAKSMKTKFNKYWGSFREMNKLVIIAVVLDPRHKLRYHKTSLPLVGLSEVAVEKVTEELKEILYSLYEEYKGNTELARPAASTSMGDVPPELLHLSKTQQRIHMQLQQEANQHESQSASNEVDRYLTDNHVFLNEVNFSVVAWWKNNVCNFPILSQIAKDVFAVPCSTVASENAFSLGSRIVDPFRASLTPRMVEALVCTSDWLKGEEVNLYKEPTDLELEFYKTLEEAEKELEKVQHYGNANPTQSDGGAINV